MFPIACLRRLLSCQPFSLLTTQTTQTTQTTRVFPDEESGCVVVRGTLIERRAVPHVHTLRKTDR